MSNIKISKFKAWILAIRPKTLWASVIPVLIGGAISNTNFFSGSNFSLITQEFLIFLIVLFTSLLLQITSNLVNDLYDFKRGADNIERVGPVRVIQSGLITEKEISICIFITILLIIFFGSLLVLSAQSGIVILIVGILSLFAAIGYTAGPFPLAYWGLGDFFAFMFFGPIAVLGTVYLLEENVSFLQLLIGFIPGLFTTAILVVNNLRDYDSDKASNKKTLAVLFGKNFVRSEYKILILLPYSVLIILYLLNRNLFLILPFLTFPFALKLIKTVHHEIYLSRKERSIALNACLSNTGKLLALFGLLFCIAWRA